jgi:hypothetical protein
MTERTYEQEIAVELRQSLDTIVHAEGGMTSADVLAACTEFWVQVFVVAFIAEDLRYPRRPWDEVMGELVGVLEAMQTAAMKRLRRAWQQQP